MPLEMRIMGNPDMTISPKHDNKLDTYYIEVFTLENAADLFQAYELEILDT